MRLTLGSFDCRKPGYLIMRFRLVIIALLLLTVGLAHWLTPIEQPFFHAVHVAMRKTFILPVVLGAVWFNLRGALVTAGIASAVYVPHVVMQWSGHPAENLNQAGELATIWAVAILSGWLVDREKSVLKQLLNSHRGAVHALVAALDAKEHETELHSLRVQAYALRIGRELNLPESQLEVLAQGALLHDIGKIGVPDRILLKPGPLNEQDWQTMRQHPEIGQRMLASVPFLDDAIEIVADHHERYDGTGYPRGLQGDQIPLNARVFAVADAFDAITTGRPYKPPLTVEEAQRRIEQSCGTHFDPNVVDSFLKVPTIEWKQIARKLGQRASLRACKTSDSPTDRAALHPLQLTGRHNSR